MVRTAPTTPADLTSRNSYPHKGLGSSDAPGLASMPPGSSMLLEGWGYYPLGPVQDATRLLLYLLASALGGVLLPFWLIGAFGP